MIRHFVFWSRDFRFSDTWQVTLKLDVGQVGLIWTVLFQPSNFVNNWLRGSRLSPGRCDITVVESFWLSFVTPPTPKHPCLASVGRETHETSHRHLYHNFSSCHWLCIIRHPPYTHEKRANDSIGYSPTRHCCNIRQVCIKAEGLAQFNKLTSKTSQRFPSIHWADMFAEALTKNGSCQLKSKYQKQPRQVERGGRLHRLLKAPVVGAMKLELSKWSSVVSRHIRST